MIFRQGFHSAGRDTDLLNHVLGISMYRVLAGGAPQQRGSAFIATTARESVVRRMARGRLQPAPGDTAERRVWIYTIRATERFFGVIRSLQRAMERMEGCEITDRLQARLISLDAGLNTARTESEWVAYRYVPPSLISHATQYRLAVGGQDIEEIPGSRIDNPGFIHANTHGNTTPWLIRTLPNPLTAIAYRVHNQANAATMDLLDRLRNATFGLQFCGVPVQRNRQERTADDTEPPSDARIAMDIAPIIEAVLNGELHDQGNPRPCELPQLQPLASHAPQHGNGTCETPEPVTMTKLPLGYAWVDERLVPTAVKWASWSKDDLHGKKNWPVHCNIDPGRAVSGILRVTCDAKAVFSDFVVQLDAEWGPHRVNTTFRGKTGTEGIALSAEQIPLASPLRPARVLADVARGHPGRQAQLIREVFDTREWHSSIIVAPVYTPTEDPHPIEWIHEEL
ncbi:hypothetical protein GCM10011289_29810 [Paludibacterium paludis]|uniref:Uncharacterized protein n=1 Tax=Paludibacterium paludis TaxID=1225769 RepID=A0A918UAR6_9NEIS|nr:hypothetical protein GCM10011289_29810 [Paludibacterium paludis]